MLPSHRSALKNGSFAVFLAAAMLAGATARADVFNMSGDSDKPFVRHRGQSRQCGGPLTGLGAVGYAYQIGEYDVTTAQYCQFLNAVATTSDPYGLYNPSMATDLQSNACLSLPVGRHRPKRQCGELQLLGDRQRQHTGVRRFLGRRGAVLQLVAKRPAERGRGVDDNRDRGLHARRPNVPPPRRRR